MSFFDDLEKLGGGLGGTLTELGGKYLDLRVAKAQNKNARNPAQNVQPNLAQPTVANPVRGVDANGNTLVVAKAPMPLMQNKTLLYGGASVLGVIVLALAYKMVK